VKTREGSLTTRTVILGRVFVDKNRDRMPDEDEPGMKGVRLYLEDGSYVVTDGEGKFSLSGIEGGEHVLKLDRSTLPAGYESVPLDSTFAGDGGSRFISLPYGGMARGDFALVPAEEGEEAKKEEQTKAPRKGGSMVFGADVNIAPPSLEQQIATMPDSPEILEPFRGAFIQKRSTDIVIRVPDGADYTLWINDTPLLQKQIGKTIVESKRKIRICQYVGVALEPGANRIALEVTRPGGAPETKEIEVTAPGEPVKVEITPDKADLSADGKTAVPFTVTLLDRWEKPVPGEQVITVVTEKGTIVEGDLDPSRDGHQLKCKDGRGSFRLRSTLKTGPDRLKVIAGTGLEGSADLFFTPEMRDWIVVGMGSLTAGSNLISGNVEKITKDDHFQDGIFQEGRLAFFAKGKILGKYLLTAAYDSDKEKRTELFQQVEPNRYYPIYGDASEKGYEAESREKYYVKIEQGRSSVLVGDFRTDLSKNEFSRYDRSFNGVKADIDTKHATLKAFATSTNQGINRDQIPGNGTSGYYFLGKKPIIENTDRIRIEVRDRYHTERVISVSDKAPYTDYSIDYKTGAILFREPVPSLDPNLNPVIIVVHYESEDPGDDNYIYGARGAVRSAKGSELGVTAVVEDKGIGKNTLYGVDGTLAVTDKIRLKGEVASSDTLDVASGTAWKAEIAAELGKARAEAYYRHVDTTFRNLSMSGAETGTEKYGAKLAYPLLDTTAIAGESHVQSDLVAGTKLTATSLGVTHRMKRFSLEGGYRLLAEQGGIDGDTSSPMVFVGVSGKITEKLEGSLLREQSFTSDTVKDYPTRTLLKLNYRLTERTSAFLTEELRESGSNEGNTTSVGLSSKLRENMVLTTSYQALSGAEKSSQAGAELSSKWDLSKSLSLTTRTGYQLQDTMTGDRGQALFGVDTSWEVAKGVRLGAKGERV